MKKIPVGKFKTHCHALLEEIRTGRKPILITKRGEPIVEVVPLKRDVVKERANLRGTIISEKGIISPVGDGWNALK